MSNHLAIATATETLRQLVDGAAKVAVPGATVLPAKPEAGASPTGPEVRLFLYQVTPNAHWRNDDLPTRRSDGSVMQRPQAAFDLHYLLSFYGNDSKQEPQRLLGSVASVLHAKPVLSRDTIQATIDAAVSSDPSHFLKDSDLDEQLDVVRITPAPLTLEELSKLWSVFFQATYVLSAAYQATIVLIETQDVPTTPLPVRQAGVYVVPFSQPTIEKVVAETADTDPIVASTVVLIQGQRLQGATTEVHIGGHDMTAAITDIQPHRITLALPSPLPSQMYAGVQTVQVVHQLEMGHPPTPHRGFDSNLAAFVLRPTLNPPATLTGPPVSELIDGVTVKTGELQVQLTPDVSTHQRVVLLLNESTPNAPARAYAIDAPRDNGIVAPATETDTIVFEFSRVAAGDYLVRVQVDGADSPLQVGATGEYSGPKVTI